MVIIYGIKFQDKIVYVGQTTSTAEKRLSKHLSLARCGKNFCPKLYNHMRKNELMGYSTTVLDACSLVDSEAREKYWIAEYKTYENWLNCHPGGNQARGKDHYSFGIRPDAAIAASVAARVGKKLSPELIAKKRLIRLGQKQPENYIAIICDQNGKTYESQDAAAKDLGIFNANISACLRGKTSAASGFTFKYADPEREANRVTKIKTYRGAGTEKDKAGAQRRLERERANPEIFARRVEIMHEAQKIANGKRMKKVRRSDGVIYDSVAAAGRAMHPEKPDQGRGGVKRSLYENMQYRGFTFELV